MQQCPLCRTEYNDLTQICPLKHCSNCGSLQLTFHKNRSFQTSRAKQNFVFLLPTLGFFVLVFGYVFVKGELISFLSIVAVFSVFFISVLFKITVRNIHCQDCNAKNFPYVCDIKLNPATKKDVVIDDKDLTQKIAKTVLEGLSKEQKRHNKRDLVIRIVGFISLVTIAILGTFFIKPDDILLGEIIELVKSLTLQR